MLLALLCACACASALADTGEYFYLENATQHFEDFISKFDKVYLDEQEKDDRFQIFVNNLQEVNQLNKDSIDAVFGITKFMDLTNEEFRNYYTGFKSNVEYGKPLCTLVYDRDIPRGKVPKSWDWRKHHAVSSVKNQGGCGSCYSFSAAAHLEGQYAIKHKKLLDLSEQEIIDCDKRGYGCDGGSPAQALRSLHEIGGIEKESYYPYTARKGVCKFNKRKSVMKVRDCYRYNLTSQEVLKRLLYKVGPLTIGIKSQALIKYTKGIIKDYQCRGGEIDHAVLLVGYGVQNKKPYWIVKNSWGASWGERGYYRMQRGEGRYSCAMMLNDGMTSAIIN